MKPVKVLLPASRWLLRISLFALLVLEYGKTFISMQYETQPFYIAFAFLLTSLLLLAGGFTAKPSLTVISAILLCVLLAYSLYLGYRPEVTVSQVVNILLFSVSLYFVSSANK